MVVVRDIEESHYDSAISANVIVSLPVLIFLVIFPFVVWIVVSVLVERVLDAFVEDLFGILGSIRSLRARNCVVQPQLV
jgi:Na+-translocating ferredoxin:NAD+ oxidoreductase RnfE subunit